MQSVEFCMYVKASILEKDITHIKFLKRCSAEILVALFEGGTGRAIKTS